MYSPRKALASRRSPGQEAIVVAVHPFRVHRDQIPLLNDDRPLAQPLEGGPQVRDEAAQLAADARVSRRPSHRMEISSPMVLPAPRRSIK